MRARWRVRYGSPVNPPAVVIDDVPSDVPVSIADEPVEEATALQTGLEEYEQGEGLDEFNFADEFFDRLASEQVTGSLPDRDAGLCSFSTDEPKGFDFVDKGEGLNAGKGMSISHVARAAPDTVVTEALRLTDKKVVLFPWEKGRMAKIFGDQGRLETKRPKLHASGNSFVRINVEVSEGLKCKTALDVQPRMEDRAIYSGVVKHVLGGSYIEEREARRSQAVIQWWDLLRLDLNCSDPGRMALNEKGLADIYKNGTEIVDASLGVKSPNTVMKQTPLRDKSVQQLADQKHRWALASSS
eukprot:s261_g29.t1